MKGLALARQFYTACRPILMREIPELMACAAAGLVGEGSECLGCDDAHSRDHDFGPAFCLWLPRETLLANTERIETALGLLPQTFAGYPTCLSPEQRHNRVGPLAIEDFYAFFTGLERPPESNREWLRIPEYHLASCTNGEIFEDNAGIFSRWRESLQAFYPHDVLLKKLAARCMIMAQAGQYNLPRSLARMDHIAAMLAAARFAEAALSFVFLCNKRYTPFYKWAGKLVQGLPILGQELHHCLAVLASAPVQNNSVQHIENFCMAAAAQLRHMHISAEKSSWLWAHGLHILQHVRDEKLRYMDMLQDYDWKTL